MANTVNPVSDKKTATDITENIPHIHGNKLAADDVMTTDQYSHIPGWGMDADDQNDPVYPMRHYNGADHQRINYDKPPQQPVTVEILHSVERPTLSRVVSDKLPPQGLSGVIRRKAFEYSEGNALHWMGLILADRVNMIEGVIEDLSRGHIPNIIEERGWKAEWKYNKKGVIKEVLIAGALIAGAIALTSSKKKKTKNKLAKAVKHAKKEIKAKVA